LKKVTQTVTELPQTVTEFCDTASDNDNIPARNMMALQHDLVSMELFTKSYRFSSLRNIF